MSVSLHDQARAVRLAAIGREAWVERGRALVAGKPRYSPDQITRDTEQAAVLHAAADTLERLASGENKQ